MYIYHVVLNYNFLYIFFTKYKISMNYWKYILLPYIVFIFNLIKIRRDYALLMNINLSKLFIKYLRTRFINLCYHRSVNIRKLRKYKSKMRWSNSTVAVEIIARICRERSIFGADILYVVCIMHSAALESKRECGESTHIATLCLRSGC